jgi:glycerol-3-phosphate dehydrogenase
MNTKIQGGSPTAGLAVSERSLRELASQHFDLIVIGGGITGAGIAQDAASRGLTVLLVDKGDFASGTSSKSTKLIHGGLRYLQNLQVMVTLESLRERELQQQLAPHMVWTVPFIVPTYSNERFKALKIGIGLWIYDIMAMVDRKRRHRKLSASKVSALCPGIRSTGLTGGFVYSDCRTDDARHTLEVIKSACAHGAVALNYTSVFDFLKEKGRIVGVRLASEEGPYDVYGSVVVNATGVWMQRVSELTGTPSNTQVAPAKGIHITLSPERLPIQAAMIVPSAHDDRFCFAVPWYDSIVVGTTDTEYSGSLEDVQVTPEEVQYCLDALNKLFPDAHYTTADVTGSYAGLRPLIRDANAKSTAEISRHHRLERAADGLISIGGGKLTTYRRMAKETVDHVVEALRETDADRKIGKCVTAKMPLSGWSFGENANDGIRTLEGVAHQDLGLDADIAHYLPTVYGKNTEALLGLIVGDQRDLTYRLSANHPHIAAQVVFAVRFEAAKTIEDVLARRIRLTITDRKAALAAAETVASLMKDELKWSAQETAAQLTRFRKDWDAI